MEILCRDVVGSIRHVVYLHGIPSSPDSSKAQRFKRELEARGVSFSCPDFNEPAFETLTTTRMLHQTMAAIAAAPAGPVALIGSSLGAFVAVLAVARTGSGGVSADSEREAVARKVDRIILLAPALDFGGNRARPATTCGFDLYADAARYDAFDVAFDQPALVYQGTRDDTVDPAMVAALVARALQCRSAPPGRRPPAHGVNGRDLAGVRAVSRGLKKIPGVVFGAKEQSGNDSRYL